MGSLSVDKTPGLEEFAENYFNTLNPIAKKIAQDINNLKLQHDNWDRFSSVNQEKMIDEYIIDSVSKRKFIDRDSEIANHCSSFPKLKLQTGQKIVVDAENDHLTWTDEHSAPFSYATQAQLDFSISGTNKDKSPGKRRQPKQPGKEETESKAKVETKDDGEKPTLRPVWSSPFLKGKLGHVNTAYTCTGSEDESSQTDIFRTFGVTLTTGNSSASMQSGETSTDDALEIKDAPSQSNSQDALKSPFDIWKDFESESARNSSVITNTRKKKSESEESLLSDYKHTDCISEKEQETNMAATNAETDLLSPAVLDISSNCSLLDSSTVTVVTEQPTSAWTQLTDDLQGDLMNSDITFSMEKEENSNASMSVTKSGFDFLDNW